VRFVSLARGEIRQAAGRARSAGSGISSYIDYG
jgi:hypothetical protein